jgi:hypothetical protein
MNKMKKRAVLIIANGFGYGGAWQLNLFTREPDVTRRMFMECFNPQVSDEKRQRMEMHVGGHGTAVVVATMMK